MTALPIVCDNCGARYKLPETFQGSQSKCQKCGSVIDVGRQRGAADTAASKATPAAGARPAAAARPAVDRSREPPPTTERPVARRASARRGREERGDGGDGRRGRRDRAKRSKLPLVLGGIGVVAVVAIVVWMLVGGGPPKAH